MCNKEYRQHEIDMGLKPYQVVNMVANGCEYLSDWAEKRKAIQKLKKDIRKTSYHRLKMQVEYTL